MSQINKKIPLFSAIIVVMVFVFFLLDQGEAQAISEAGRIVELDNLQTGKDFALFEDSFLGGASICAGDFNGNGKKEIMIGSGPGRRSEVRLFDANGKKTNYVIYPFGTDFLGGVDLACGDIDNDGRDEIAIAVASGASAEIKIYKVDSAQTLIAQFLGEPEVFKGGAHIALADLDQDGEAEVLVSRGQGTRSEVRVFQSNGQRKNFILYPFPAEFKGGADIAAGDVDGDGKIEIIASASREDQALVKIFDAQGKPKSSFIAFDQGFRGGVNISVADINYDGRSEILAGAGPGGGPHVRVFNAWGQIQTASANIDSEKALGGDPAELQRVSGLEINASQNNYSYYAFGESFRGGVNLAAADLDQDGRMEIVNLPALNYNFNGPKKIVIDISEQKLRAYSGEKLFLETIVSTGKYSMPTPLGNFKILSKNPRAWSSKYGLYMPFWMAFTTRGHGLHELPEWPGGYKEGANHLGVRVSHGCVRLGVGPAKQLYDWAEVGTAVIVQN